MNLQDCSIHPIELIWESSMDQWAIPYVTLIQVIQRTGAPPLSKKKQLKLKKRTKISKKRNSYLRVKVKNQLKRSRMRLRRENNLSFQTLVNSHIKRTIRKRNRRVKYLQRYHLKQPLLNYHTHTRTTRRWRPEISTLAKATTIREC